MARKKSTKVSPTREAYNKQWDRIERNIRKLEKQGFTFNRELLPEVKKRPMPASVEALKEIKPRHLRRMATTEVAGTTITASDIFYTRQEQKKQARRKKKEKLKNANTETTSSVGGGYLVTGQGGGYRKATKRTHNLKETTEYEVAQVDESGEASVEWLGYSEDEPIPHGEIIPNGSERGYYLVGDLGGKIADIGEYTMGKDERGTYFQSKETGEKWYHTTRTEEEVDYYRVIKTLKGEKIVWLKGDKGKTPEDLGEVTTGIDSEGAYIESKETGQRWYRGSRKSSKTDLIVYRNVPSVVGNAISALYQYLKPTSYYDNRKQNSFTQLATENLVRLYSMLDVLRKQLENGEVSVFDNVQSNISKIEDLIYKLTRDYAEIRDHSAKNFALLYEAITGERLDALTALAIDSAEEMYYETGDISLIETEQ